jgi:hypothetical protein
MTCAPITRGYFHSVFRRYDIVHRRDIQHAGEQLSCYFLEQDLKEGADIAADRDMAKDHAG